MNLKIVILFILSLCIIIFLILGLGHAPQPYVLISDRNGEKCTINLIIAETPDEMRYGLMNEKDLPEDTGMLFIFEKPGKYAFWMKNTLIPLDMIFISQDLQIVDIKKNLAPNSEEIITSDEISAYLIEVNGGYCDRNHVTIDDTISLHLGEAY